MRQSKENFRSCIACCNNLGEAPSSYLSGSVTHSGAHSKATAFDLCSGPWTIALITAANVNMPFGLNFHALNKSIL